ncbi:RsmB/NOP family class I SAM-dependent RNA methyltransferase [Paracoccus seriniphilus]|uniref:16S rRNA (Cytosine967-C5)-methyltransferase n=1 Tax=Paracoccus seriniphilus TaxID=184748 RepID=A0A239PW84_9RHOB|nr:RsmB/NOP family class I SAM-dependent RNA methyltransferase [Paracoccus seriniphilus]WCR13339.1 RsmB/NOP family class I SAM-dependent RNA methyltransferase [Paracoccus seriniphilus]SNT74420.1 16S rRNA (cytosine967-C5)-methyltransferase [Paracoccus seriniphilus]
MTPAARIASAIEILDRVLAGHPAEQSLLRWSRASRFAGSGDRAAVRDLVFEALRRRNSLAALGGGCDGRRLMIGMLRDGDTDPDTVFTGMGHAPAALSDAERHQGVDSPPVIDLPEWILPFWRESLGEEADRIAALMGQRAPVWLRVNGRKSSVEQALAALADDGVEAKADDRLEGALQVTSGERRIARSGAYLEGLVELQDLSPQMACAALPLKSGDRVLDYCAGGGGKALALACRQGGLKIDAHDADPGRMQDIPARAARAGVSIRLTDRVAGKYQLVVADVPCSGSGTWRRSPDAKWRLDEKNLDNLTATQSQILDSCSKFVAPAGHLAYMTCSLLDEENDRQIAAFLSRNDRFSLISRQLWTPVTASDGFFLALLQRNP